MFNPDSFDGLVDLLDRVLGRERWRPTVWGYLWTVGFILVMAVVVFGDVPTGAHIILLVVRPGGTCRTAEGIACKEGLRGGRA